MKVKALSIVPPPGVDNPRVTPELLASVLARYSRSNDGLDEILNKVDPNNPDKSIDSILKFVDYGHASIAGLTGTIPMAIDGITMTLATMLFNLAQKADGQESSTRYIPMTDESLPNFEELGFTPNQAYALEDLCVQSLDVYHAERERLDKLAAGSPEKLGLPTDLKPAVRERMIRNYSLDRARYYLPLCLKTNVSLVMTAREWVELICGLLSCPWSEAQTLGGKLRDELEKYTPRLTRHARATEGWKQDWFDFFHSCRLMSMRPAITNTPGYRSSDITVMLDDPDVLYIPECEDLNVRESRYDRAGWGARRAFLDVTFQGIPMAELRDLNRHRNGARRVVLGHQGFFLPPEVQRDENLLYAHYGFLTELAGSDQWNLLPYTLLLGSQGKMIHVQSVAHWAYEIELRTGPGAHFVYADIMRKLHTAIYESSPAVADSVRVGSAELEPI